MKITVISNGIVKVEGSSLAEEIEMRNKLQAQGKSYTPIEYEGSLQNCLDWIMGKSESELDEVEDEDDLNEDEDDYEYEHENVYVLIDEDGQKLEIEIADVVDYIEENSPDAPSELNWSDVEIAIENYLCERPEISASDFGYFLKSGQVEELTDMVYYDNL